MYKLVICLYFLVNICLLGKNHIEMEKEIKKSIVA